MITMESLRPPVSGQATDPVLRGVTRGLARALEPLGMENMPDHLAELVRRLEEVERRR